MSTRKESEEKIILKALKDPAFREELKSNPKAVLSREFNTEIPDNISVDILEETATQAYIVIPALPEVAEELSEEELEAVAGGAVIFGRRSDGGWGFVTY